MCVLLRISSLPETVLCIFFNDTATTEIYTLSLHDALPISVAGSTLGSGAGTGDVGAVETGEPGRSEEHTSELQSRRELGCRLLLEKKQTILNRMRVCWRLHLRLGVRRCAVGW